MKDMHPLAVAAVLLSASCTSQSSLVEKSLVIVMDGVRSDALSRAETPTLNMLLDGSWQGNYQTAYTFDAQSVQDTAGLSGPNHVAIQTGVTAVKSGVATSAATDIGYGNYDEYPHYYERLKEVNSSLKTAVLTGWDGDMHIPHQADFTATGVARDLVTEAVKILKGGHNNYATKDRCEYRVTEACWEHVCFSDSYSESCRKQCQFGLDMCVQGAWHDDYDIDLMYIFLDNPDNPGHQYGFPTTNYKSDVDGKDLFVQRIEQTDGYIGRLLETIEKRSSFGMETWQIIITSDHGGYAMVTDQAVIPATAVPFFIVSRSISNTVKIGLLPTNTHNYDAAATVLTHFAEVLNLSKGRRRLGDDDDDYDYADVGSGSDAGSGADADPGSDLFDDKTEVDDTLKGLVGALQYLDGQPRGSDNDVTSVSSQMIDLNDDLIAYYRFENNYYDTTDGENNAEIGGDFVPALISSGGLHDGGYVNLGQSTNGEGTSYIELKANPSHDVSQFDFTTCANSWSTLCRKLQFTVAMWYRPHVTKGRTAKMLIGNKDWELESNGGEAAGWMLVTELVTLERNDKKELRDVWALKLNAGITAAGTGATVLLPETPAAEKDNLNSAHQEWVLVVATLDSNSGTMQLYSGSQDGYLRHNAVEFEPGLVEDLLTDYPIHLGNDGPANYENNLDADVDDLMMWHRALTRKEIEALYNEGRPLSLWIAGCPGEGSWPPVPAGGRAYIKADCNRGKRQQRECVVDYGYSHAYWGESSGCVGYYGGGDITGVVVGVLGALVVLGSVIVLWKFCNKKRKDYEEINEGEDGVGDAKTPPAQASPATPTPLPSAFGSPNSKAQLTPTKPKGPAGHRRGLSDPLSTVFSEATVE